MNVPDLAGLARALRVDPPVRWVLIGRLAVVLHGGRYSTSDADISFASDPQNVDQLVFAIGHIHAKQIRTNLAVDALMIQACPFVHLDSDVGLIDLIPTPPGKEFEGLLSRASHFVVGGEMVKVASLEDLREMKVRAGRTRDLIQLIEIENILKSQEGDV